MDLAGNSNGWGVPFFPQWQSSVSKCVPTQRASVWLASLIVPPIPTGAAAAPHCQHLGGREDAGKRLECWLGDCIRSSPGLLLVWGLKEAQLKGFIPVGQSKLAHVGVFFQVCIYTFFSKCFSPHKGMKWPKSWH